MNPDLIAARDEVQKALAHLWQVIQDNTDQTLEKEERNDRAEYTMDKMVVAELVLVQNGYAK